MVGGERRADSAPGRHTVLPATVRAPSILPRSQGLLRPRPQDPGLAVTTAREGASSGKPPGHGRGGDLHLKVVARAETEG